LKVCVEPHEAVYMPLEVSASTIVGKWRGKNRSEKVIPLFLVYRCPPRESTGF